MKRYLWAFILPLLSIPAWGQGGNATRGGNNTFTGSNTESNAGVFTNAAMNEYWQSLINSCSPLTEFQAAQGANFSTDGMVGCVAVPNSATVWQVNGLAGYANTGSGNSTFTNAVGVYGQSRCLASLTLCYGFNGVVQDLVGTSASLMTGYELDVNVIGTPTTVKGFTVAGASTGTIPASAAAYEIDTLGSGKTWPFGMFQNDGTVNGGAYVVGTPTTSANANSNAIVFHSRDSGNVVRSGQFFQPSTVSANRQWALPNATGTISLGSVQFCGATTGGTQACAGTAESLPITVFGDVLLNSATTQSITTLPFTAGADYSCTGSDLTTAAGIVSFNTYAAASVTIQESGGTNADHLRYICVGF